MTVCYAGLGGNPIKKKKESERIDTISSPDDEHMSARNMHRYGIKVYDKRSVRQVGHLQELYRDARSTKHKKWLTVVVTTQNLQNLFYHMPFI